MGNPVNTPSTVVAGGDGATERELPFKVKAVLGKGMAAFATQIYAAGDLVFSEDPLLVIHAPQPGVAVMYNDGQVAALRAMEAALPRSSRAAVAALSNAFGDALDSHLVGTFRTNCFDMDGKGAALYPTLARLNHSCSPNCRHSYSHDMHTNVHSQSITATRAVAAGEELTISYIDIRGRSTQDRRELLLQRYCFSCDCGLCTAVSSNATLRRFMPSA